MKKYKLKNQTYAEAFGVLFGIKHLLNIEFTEGQRWHKVALDHGVMHWFEEVDEFAHLPKSVDEIEGRKWFISNEGEVTPYHMRHCTDLNHLTSESRARAFLALMQLVELRDAWNGIPVPVNEFRYVIILMDTKLNIFEYTGAIPRVLSFTSEDLAKAFLEQFRDLIETAKELI